MEEQTSHGRVTGKGQELRRDAEGRGVRGASSGCQGGHQQHGRRRWIRCDREKEKAGLKRVRDTSVKNTNSYEKDQKGPHKTNSGSCVRVVAPKCVCLTFITL